MRALSAHELLAVWERALAQHPLERALSLLAAASPDESWDTLAALSIGERDARLLTLREWTFGPGLSATVPCPTCGEGVELNFQTSDIRSDAYATPELTMQFDGEPMRFRLPNSRDLLAIAHERDVSAARARLVERCVEHDDGSHLPATLVDTLSARMAEADPQANVRLALTCPRCSHEWLATFDVLSYFWTELGAWVRHLLRDVHTLASAYGWHERNILALSPLRRQLYLDMVNA